MDQHKNNEEDNLYRIREILFGKELQSVNQRFTEIKLEWEENLSRSKTDTDEQFKSIESFQESQTKQLEEIKKDFQEKLEAFQQEIQGQLSSLEQQIKDHEKYVDGELESIWKKQVSKADLADLLQGIVDKLQ